MTPTEYLETEFRRYFPTSDLTVEFDGDEAIHVHVATPIPESDIANHFHLTSWSCVIGSDDDRYVFVRCCTVLAPMHVLTVPLMTEA